MTDAAVPDPLITGEWELYRVELMGYCYRMLGSPYDAEEPFRRRFCALGAVAQTMTVHAHPCARGCAESQPITAWMC